MAKKDKINVERIGKNTGRPITSSPVPVRHALFQDRVPLYLDPNGTMITSTVDRDGTNRQTFSKSNGAPSYGFIINGADSTALRYNEPGDILAYKKFKPGSAEFKRIAEDSKQYNVPLATYGEASDNFNEVQRQAEQFQAGGSIASRLWNKWTGKDKYVDGYGTTRSHVPVKESAHRTALKAADSPLIQAIPVVGDIADGYVAADYATKGDYKPAIAAIGAGLVLPDMLESGARYIPKDTWRDALKKFDDVDLDAKLDDVTTGVLDDVKKYLDDVKSGKIKLTKDISELTDNEKEALIRQRVYESYRKGRIPNDTYQNFGPNDLDIDKPYVIPEKVIADEGWGTQVLRDNSTSSREPWWGWDPVEYQQGGEIPSNDQQQQLFVSIITDMANVLGVEPSQELAEAVMTAFENNDDSQGLITLFTQIKDKHMNETGLFREGGKMNAFIEKFKCGGKATKPKKKQEGGEIEYTKNNNTLQGADLTRNQARDLAKLNRGYSNDNFRTAYQNAKAAISNNTDLRGRDKRMAARRMVSGMEQLDRQLVSPVSQAPELNMPTPTIDAPKSLAWNYDNFDFNDAFSRARGNGEDTFMWRGKEYTTDLAPERPSLPLTGSPTVGGGNFYDPTTDPRYARGAEWREKVRARRAARRAQNA